MVDATSARDAPDGERYRRLIERVPAAIFELANAPDFTVRYASPATERITGYSVDEWASEPDLWRRALFSADRDRVLRGWAAAVEQGRPFHAEYRLIRRDGSLAWVRETIHPLRGQDGDITGWQGVTLEISEQRFAEEAAARSEARYRRLVEHLPVVVYVDSPEVEPRSLYVSPNASEILGYSPADYLNDAGLWKRTIHPEDIDRVLESWARVVDRERTFAEEYRFVRPDGEVVWVRDSSVPVEDDEGNVVCWQGVIIDVTGTKDVEDELRRSERRFRALVEQVPAVVYEMFPDDERRTLYVSPHVEAILGYTRREWLEQPDIWMELLDEADRETELAAHDRHAETREPWDREYRLIAADGRRVWIRDQATFVEDPATGQARWYGVMLDISAQKEGADSLRLANDELEFRVLARTAELEDANEMMSLEIAERRRAEEGLRVAQQRYRELIEDLPAVVYAWETNWRDRTEELVDPAPLPYMSPKIEELVGYTTVEWQRVDFWKERLHPHDREWVSELAERCALTGEPFTAEYRYLAKDGRIIWVLDRAILRVRDNRGLPAYFQGVMLDITQRKEAEAKAEDAEERFRQLAEQAPVATFIYRYEPEDDPPVHLEYMSPQAHDLLGSPPGELVEEPRRWLDLVHPDDREEVLGTLKAAWSTGNPLALEYRIIRGDGTIGWIRTQSKVVERDEEGRPRRIQGAMMDVTVARLPMTEIAEREAELRSLVEGLDGLPWRQVFDPRTGVERNVYIGPQSLDMLGYTPEELIAEPRHFTRMVHPEDRGLTAGMSRESKTTGRWSGSFRVIARDGSIRHLRGYARRTITDEGLHVWNGVTFDETERVLSSEDGARERAPEGTDGASPEAPPSRPPAGGSRAGR